MTPKAEPKPRKSRAKTKAPAAIDRTPEAPEPDHDPAEAISVADIQRADRRAECMRLRNRGMTLTAIGEKLGINASTVSLDIQRGLKAILREPAEEMVATQRSIIRDIRAAMYPYMLAGDEKAADKIMKTLDHEAKLFGLYAPERVSINGGNEDFATTAVKLMQDLGITPGPGVGNHPHQAAIEIGTDTILDAEVTSELEDDLMADWTNT